MAHATASIGPVGWFSNRLEPRGGDLADGLDVIHKRDPNHVHLRRIRVTPNVLARPHDDPADAIREQMLGGLGSQRCNARRANESDSSAFDH